MDRLWKNQKKSQMGLPIVLVQVYKLELAGNSEKQAHPAKKKIMASSVGSCCLCVATIFVGPQPSI